MYPIHTTHRQFPSDANVHFDVTVQRPVNENKSIDERYQIEKKVTQSYQFFFFFCYSSGDRVSGIIEFN